MSVGFSLDHGNIVLSPAPSVGQTDYARYSVSGSVQPPARGDLGEHIREVSRIFS